MDECVICLEEGHLIRPCPKCTVIAHEHCWCTARSISNACPVCRHEFPTVVDEPPKESWLSRHRGVIVNTSFTVGGALTITCFAFLFAYG